MIRSLSNFVEFQKYAKSCAKPSANHRANIKGVNRNLSERRVEKIGKKRKILENLVISSYML